MRNCCKRTLVVSLLLVVLVACRREQPAQPTAPVAPEVAPAATATTDEQLKDVTEHTPDYIIGISYPAIANKYPPLAAELKRYADTARAELMQAVQGRQKGQEAAAYELVLPFTELHVSPTLVAVGVEVGTPGIADEQRIAGKDEPRGIDSRMVGAQVRVVGAGVARGRYRLKLGIA